MVQSFPIETSPFLFRLTRDAGAGTNFDTVTGSVRITTKIDALIATNDDTISHDVEVRLFVGGDPIVLGRVAVPAGTGFATSPALDILPTLMPAAIEGFALPTFCPMEARVVVSI